MGDVRAIVGRRTTWRDLDVGHSGARTPWRDLESSGRGFTSGRRSIVRIAWTRLGPPPQAFAIGAREASVATHCYDPPHARLRELHALDPSASAVRERRFLRRLAAGLLLREGVQRLVSDAGAS